MDDADYDIPGVHPEPIDNDDIFSPKLWEILVAPVAASVLYVLEAPILWWVIALWRQSSRDAFFLESHFELVINLKEAAERGLQVPAALVARADVRICNPTAKNCWA